MPPHNASFWFSRLSVIVAFAALCVLAISVPSLAPRPQTAEAAPYTMRPVALGGLLTVSPTFLSNCMQCTVTVSNTSNNKTLFWFATSQGVSGITINPRGGALQPQKQVSVTITIPSNTTCPARATINFSANQANSVSVSWSCSPTPTPSPTPSPTPAPSPTALSTDTPAVSQTPSPTVTVTVSTGGGPGQQNNGNPPADNSGGSGASALSILFTVAGLLLGALAFLLYLIPPSHSSLRIRLLSLVMPVSMARRIDQDH